MDFRLVRGDLSPWAAGQFVTFRLLSSVGTWGTDGRVLNRTAAARVDENGLFSVRLAVPEVGRWDYECMLPDGRCVEFSIGPSGTPYDILQMVTA